MACEFYLKGKQNKTDSLNLSWVFSPLVNPSVISVPRWTFLRKVVVLGKYCMGGFQLTLPNRKKKKKKNEWSFRTDLVMDKWPNAVVKWLNGRKYFSRVLGVAGLCLSPFLCITYSSLFLALGFLSTPLPRPPQSVIIFLSSWSEYSDMSSIEKETFALLLWRCLSGVFLLTVVLNNFFFCCGS